MRLIAVLIIVFHSHADASEAPPLVSSALGWFETWGRSVRIRRTPQVCRGDSRSGSYVMRCEPLDVVVSVTRGAGRCLITNMRATAFQSDGLHANTWSAESVSEPVCGELPKEVGPFRFTVVPRRKQTDLSLSAEGRDSALKYLKETGLDACDAYFPRISLGDPFFHVYRVCTGVLVVLLSSP